MVSMIQTIGKEDIKTFKFNNMELRIITVNNEAWFIAKDVSDILEYRDPSTATRNLESNEKLLHTLHVAGQSRKTTLINESGLYELIFGSRKPEAKAFKKWVKTEVLPSIRRTGGYVQEGRAIDFVNSWLPQVDDVTKGVIASTLESNRKLVLENKTLTTTIEEQTPKVQAYQHLLDSSGHMRIGDFAKHINIGRNTFLKMLRDDGIMMKDGGSNVPKQSHMKYFHVISKSRRGFGDVYDVVSLLNMKGVEYLTKKYATKTNQLTKI